MNGRLTLADLIQQIQQTKNPVTYWALKQCIIDRLNRRELT